VNSKRLVSTAVALAVTAAVAVTAIGSGSAARLATIQAGLVSDVGRFNDKGFNQSQFVGLNRAKSQLGVTVQAIESKAPGDYIPNFTTLARQNFNIIIGAGFLLAADLGTVAKQFPAITFAITDDSTFDPAIAGKGSTGPLPNVAGLTYASQENSYLAGCLAALMAKKAGKLVIGAVGGIKIPPVDSFLAGYKAGAAKCVAGIKVLIGYSNSFTAQDKCKVVALQQIAAGSQVEFNVAGPCGFGTLNAAKQKKVWGIGVDVDQSYLGPHILTSVVKHVDVGVFLAIKAVKDGMSIGGTDLVFNLKNGGCAIGKTSSKAPKAFIKMMDGLKAQIIAGTIKPPGKL
jgi:basic membrane protein A